MGSSMKKKKEKGFQFGFKSDDYTKTREVLRLNTRAEKAALRNILQTEENKRVLKWNFLNRLRKVFPFLNSFCIELMDRLYKNPTPP